MKCERCKVECGLNIYLDGRCKQCGFEWRRITELTCSKMVEGVFHIIQCEHGRCLEIRATSNGWRDRLVG